MKLYLEDNERMASSQLLLRMMPIDFKGTNTQIEKLIMDGTYDHDSIVYLDVVPDNNTVRKMYQRIYNHIKINKLRDKVHIFPIPCAEYMILKSLYALNIDFEFKYPWLQRVLDSVLRGQTIKNKPPRVIGYKGSFMSFEKQCKLVLDNCDARFVNYNMQDSKYLNLNIKSYYLYDSDGLSLDTKGISLIQQFPMIYLRCIYSIPETHTTKFDMKRVCEFYNDRYKKWLYADCKVILEDKWWEKY